MNFKNIMKKNEIENIDFDIPPTLYNKIENNIIIDLTKLSELVILRYKLLKDIEIQISNNKNIIQNINIYIPEIIKWEYNNESLKNDMGSFFILALIMSKKDNDLKWFIRHEAMLYEYRLVKSKKYNIVKILRQLGLEIKEYKKKNNSLDINKIKFNATNKSKNNLEKIYYCNFEYALNLVPTHQYYLNKGYIFIPENQIIKILRNYLEKNFENTLLKIRTKYDIIINDIRNKKIITIFEKEKNYIINEESIKGMKDFIQEDKLKNASEIDKLSEKFFPLCMCLINRHINKFSHLMHFGRLQYTLFLKGAGLPIEEALKYFQKKFEKKTPIDKFEKEYAYNIRHSYGLEGKRANYLPYTCDKIINLVQPNGKECHGCPFKTYSNDNLRTILKTCNLDPLDIEEVIDRKANNEYQLACNKYFEVKFPKILGEGIGIHPNKYFSSAINAMKKLNNKKIK